MSIFGADPQARKDVPIYSGVIAYFPRALAAVARLSKKGNDQHNPGSPLHWDRSKSGDELDALMRHIVDGDWDAVAWRALAHCEKQLELEEDEWTIEGRIGLHQEMRTSRLRDD